MGLLYALMGVVGLIAAFVLAVYNSLVVLRVRVKEAWSGIDVQLKRRADLIPNLVETVKGYASHEKKVFLKVTEARSALMKANSPVKAAQADNILTGALKSLFAVAEAYPELKASDNFKDLQRQLEDTEDKVAYARQFYNQQVLELNTKIQIFPHVIIANMFGFKRVEFFEAEEKERENVKVKFS